MTSLYLSIVLISVFAIGFVYYYASRTPARVDFANDGLHTESNLQLVFPVLAIVFAAVMYFLWPTLDKQLGWEEVKSQSETLKLSGDPRQVEMSMQDFILSIRTQAYENPGRGDIWFELGSAYLRLNMEEAALASWQRAIQIQENPDWLVAMAQVLGTKTEAVDQRRAVNFLQRALAQSPRHQGALLTLGFTYARSQQFQEAISVWQQFSQIPGISQKSKDFIQQQIAQARAKIAQKAQ